MAERALPDQQKAVVEEARLFPLVLDTLDYPPLFSELVIIPKVISGTISLFKRVLAFI